MYHLTRMMTAMISSTGSRTFRRFCTTWYRWIHHFSSTV